MQIVHVFANTPSGLFTLHTLEFGTDEDPRLLIYNYFPTSLWLCPPLCDAERAVMKNNCNLFQHGEKPNFSYHWCLAFFILSTFNVAKKIRSLRIWERPNSKFRINWSFLKLGKLPFHTRLPFCLISSEIQNPFVYSGSPGYSGPEGSFAKVDP